MKMRICFVLFSFCSAATLFAREPILMKWRVETVQREALVFSPSTTTDAKAPVIFAFHGHGGNMRFAARGMHFQDQWPEAIVVYMQGLPTPGLILDREGLRPGWQRAPGEQNNRDLKFFDQVLASLREKYAVEDRRIYASGFSNGGLFTYLLWAERPNVFAAFAPGGAVILSSVHLTRVRACLHYGGRNDRLARFAKQEQTINEVRNLNKCGEPKPCGEYCTLYPSDLQTPVMTYIHPGGHLYPPPVTALIVKFFQQHARGS